MDIVVLYCDDTDNEWLNSFNHFKELELGAGANRANNRQAFGVERYRDWDAFKYWFRGVEENCKWVNKVYLVVARESQVPYWLNTNNEKLQVVYHRDFVPKELLPTFNGLTAEFYVSFIKGLSDKFIYCNDDFYFINDTPLDKFYRENKLVFEDYQDNFHYYPKKYEEGSDGVFYKFLNNNLKFLHQVTNGNCHFYKNPHLPIIRDTTFEREFIKEHWGTFLESHSYSRFRNEHIYTSALFNWVYRDTKDYITDNIYANSKYVTLKSDVNYSLYTNCDMVCFNDTEQLDDFEATKKVLLKFLADKLPYRSSFELPLNEDKIKVSVIIPVYNQENLVIKCLQSIPKRQDIEIIVVDDASTDNTREKLIEYRNLTYNDLRLVLCAENHGVSHARNLGMDRARGQYILFIDSDDYIIGGNFNTIVDNYVYKNKYDMIFYNIVTNGNFLFEANKQNYKTRCGCYKFIKKDYIGNLKFPKGINYAEDKMFYTELIKRNPVCKFTNLNMYHYNFPRKNSLCWQKGVRGV